MTTHAKVPCGVYGKLSANADFVHRDLPRSFVGPWDQWLSGGLAASRQALGEKWVSTYLKSPPWRFAIDAGLAGPSPWIGLVVSSIDHVQRYFPLTLAVALPDGVILARLRCDFDPFLEQMEEIALDLVSGERAVDAAMDEIGSIAWRVHQKARAPLPLLRSGDGGAAVYLDQSGAPTVSAMIGEFMTEGHESGLSCWWHRGYGGRAQTRVVAYGLPPAAGFAGFLDASWASHGWMARD
jgi:type VI secretion system protein ImpM